MHVAVEHARHALRRPHRLRLRRSVRQARARAMPGPRASRRSGRTRASSTLRADLNAGGSSFCGDCPLKLPLRGEAPTERSLDVGRLPNRLYIECTAACNISCAEACCAPETGHHENAQRRHARLRSLQERRRRGRARARAHRLLQLRRGVPAQARDRDVRVHQERAFRTSISTPARTA